MKSAIQFCKYEAAVERAANLNVWTEELQNHVQSCSSCATLCVTVHEMRELARDSITVAPEPDSKLLVLQAQLREHQAQRRKQRMLVNVNLAACTIASSTGLLLSSIYGAPQANVALPNGTLETMQNMLPSSWAFCLLLATLGVAWIVFENGASE